MAKVKIIQPTTVEDFGSYFTALMAARGLNNTELGRLSGVNNGTISNWRNNKGGQPSVENLRAVAPHVGVRFGDLLVASGHATPEELGMVGAPPPPGAPLTPTLMTLAAEFADPRTSHWHKRMLDQMLSVAHRHWNEMRHPPIEPAYREAVRARAR